MLVNGREAMSGTIVVAAGQSGAIDLPWGSFELVFEPRAAEQKIELNINPNRISFLQADSPLGLATNINVPLANGQTATLVLAIYAIGEADAATRILHYTVA